MADETRTREQLIAELAQLRADRAEDRERLAVLESEAREREPEERQNQVLRRMRDLVWSMTGPDDVIQVVEAFRDGLKNLGNEVYGYGINVIESEDPLKVVYYAATQDRSEVTVSDNHAGDEVVLRMWRQGKPVYRPDLLASDPDGELGDIEYHFGKPVRSVLDVPFSSGTMAVNSLEPDAFSPGDIRVMQTMSEVLTEGLGRMRDLQSLEERNRQLQESQRLLSAMHEISREMLSSLDAEQILDSLGQQVVAAGVFRSLMVAVVDEQRKEVRARRGFHRDETEARVKEIGITFDWDDDDIVAETARTGQLQVAVEWDERFTRQSAPNADGLSAGTPEYHKGQVAYFIPVKQDDRVLAVLATGSPLEEKPEVLRRIELLQPLWDQVAIALQHGESYAEIQRQIAEREETERALRREYDIRESETAVRVMVAEMAVPEDLFEVVQEISSQLSRLGTAHDSGSLQVLNAEKTDFVSCTTDLQDKERRIEAIADLTRPVPRQSSSIRDFPWVLEVWRSGKPCYQPCTAADSALPAGWSVLDVPFSHGTLGINRRLPNAFGDDDIDLVARLARILSEGFQRLFDIIERESAQEALIQSSRLISLGQMSAGMAHEVSQPLTVISTLADGLQVRLEHGVEVTSEHLLKWSRDTVAAVERICALLEHLRVFSRDQSRAPMKPLALNDVVGDALTLTRAQLVNRGITVSLDLAEGLAEVSGASSRLEQALLNLIFNARDALEEKRDRMSESDRTDWHMQATIRTRQMAGEVVVEVVDNGDGIGVEDRTRVFEPFYTTKGPDRGTGLGLSISYAIVKDHGGEIECDSQVGEGTTFRVRLPVRV